MIKSECAFFTFDTINRRLQHFSNHKPNKSIAKINNMSMSVETRNWQWRNQRKSQQHRFASYCKFNTYVRELFKIQNSNINTLIYLVSLDVRFRSEESLTHAGIPGNRSVSSNISSLKGDKRNMDKKQRSAELLHRYHYVRLSIMCVVSTVTKSSITRVIKSIECNRRNKSPAKYLRE